MASTEGNRLWRVAIIGAGAAGLVSAKHAFASPEKFIVTTYEQGTEIGGTWIYSDKTTDENNRAVHSSMYKSLRTNLPKETMAFLDFPFLHTTQSFLQREEVLEYLERYARHFHVIDSIQFNTRVVEVSPVMNEGRSCWTIELEKVETGKRWKTIHDAVMVCNGHFSHPRIPDIPGLDSFVGLVIHSHSYRTPERFRGLKVVCLGAGSSGIDISGEIAHVAETVYFSHTKSSPIINSGCPPNLVEVPGIIRARNNGLLTSDGQWLEANALIFCTGYYYAFPFLSPSCRVRVKENRVTPLYKHLINIEHPTMALVGLPFRVCPFPTFDLQAQYFLATLTGKIKLPSRHTMMAELENELKTLDVQGVPFRFTHQMESKQWDYFAELASSAGSSPPKDVVKNLYNHVRVQRMLYPYSYRQKNYSILDAKEFMELSEVKS